MQLFLQIYSRYSWWIRKDPSNSAGTLITENQDIANVFSDSFANEYTIEPLDSPPDIATPQSRVSLSNVDYIEEEIHVKRPDEISTAILKECASALPRPLSLLMRQSLNSGQVPDDWSHS
ncbi:hypothetical protein Zmor_010928 [Zophobas morio]|uniref:Uncharacterized protein n=1 Tax=Zophobas morio TaxID=2755281 RepID=A0AA38MKE4_9CUCU|nr:hypothetical protein Zmor_010928 [Zophobas morio]